MTEIQTINSTELAKASGRGDREANKQLGDKIMTMIKPQAKPTPGDGPTTAKASPKMFVFIAILLIVSATLMIVSAQNA